MANLARSRATLRLFGDDLIPNDVSRMIGAQPTSSAIKGQLIRLGPKAREIVSPTGRWALKAEEQRPGDVDAQVAEILGKLTTDLSVWGALARTFKIDLFCGFNMQEWNEGISLCPQTLQDLGSRGILLDIDLYVPGYD